MRNILIWLIHTPYRIGNRQVKNIKNLLFGLITGLALAGIISASYNAYAEDPPAEEAPNPLLNVGEHPNDL